jgi:outer membrane protein TolC
VKWGLPFYLFTFLPLSVSGQRMLSLDSCRALALRNNKELAVSRVKQDVAANLRKSARTKYLPHVSLLGAYEWTSREVSILNNDQKEALSNIGTNVATGLQSSLGTYAQILPPAMQQKLGADVSQLAGYLDQRGQHIVDAFRTDTRNIFAGAVMVTQPIFMGGAIKALNNMADIGEQLAANSTEGSRQNTLYSIDKAYWQVVSLHHKQKLAQSYYDLVKKFEGDVHKMIEEGVATRSEGLSVSVKVNEAEMSLTKVNDGLVLSRMLLCQLCGLPLDEQVVLVDEEPTQQPTPNSSQGEGSTDEFQVPLPSEGAGGGPLGGGLLRPELKMLQNMVDLSRETTHLLKAGNLPQVLLMGGYAISNPNPFNGWEKKFKGLFNVGVMVRIPVWNWGDVAYKVRASKGATTIATLQLDEAREKIELQVSQCSFQLSEANKKLEMAKASTRHADENLRTANLGFSEGVIQPSTVLEAQTAWLKAQSEKIDAEIDVKLSQVNLQKALGVLR